MFMPCPTCGFLVALIAGREASQRCPRCGSALLAEGDVLEASVDPQSTERGAGRIESPDEAKVARVDAHRSAGPTPTETGRRVERVEARVPAPDIEQSDAREGIPPRGVDAVTAPAIHTGKVAAVDITGEAEPAVAPQAPGRTHDGPSFVRRRAARPRGRRWPLVAIVATLAVVFALQLLLAQRAALAADARWRPLVMRTCGLLGCDVPAWREPEAYRMVARNVRPNPRRPGVLHVTATVRNDARWPQPAPVIVLSLSDLDGRLVGARAVTPRDYGQRVAALVAPGDSLDVAFDVREPASRVESYDFQLQ